MLKKSAFFIFILMIVSGMILLIQWIGYEKTSKAFQQTQVDQEIHLEHNETGLFIKHTFTNLEAEEPLEVIIPANALNASCSKQEGKCSFKGQSASIVPSGSTLSVTYSMKMPSFQKAFLLTDWSVKLKEAKANNTAIYFTEKKMRKGRWLSGFSSAGVERLDLIDYYLFQGKGEPGPLYWQLKPLKQLESAGTLTVYSEAESRINQQQFKLLREATNEQLAVIFTGEHPAYLSSRLIIVEDNRQLSQLAESFISEAVLQKYHFKEGEEWLRHLIVSYKLGRPSGSEKLKLIYTSLNEQLTKEEETEWKTLLFSLTEEPIAAEQLDHSLAAVKGMDTVFFSKNKNENKQFQPLFFQDDRTVAVNGQETKLQPLIQKGNLFFPFAETLQALGYEVKSLTDGKSLLVKREYHTYRFYPEQNRFILNEEDYGLYDHALQTYDGKLYINEKWLQKIFLVSVQKSSTITVEDLDL